MSAQAVRPFHPAGEAFDSIAEEYDRIFTHSTIGRAQRDAVWEVARRTFSPASYILELNCGTGEDAFFLSRLGMKVYACDASENMIAVARKRQRREAPFSAVEFDVLATENLRAFGNLLQFDGVFSNFGGLNCVTNLADLGRHLASLVKPGGVAVLILCSRVCLWEIAWFLCHGQFRRALRRVKGSATPALNGLTVQVQYPTVRSLRTVMHPWFVLRKVKSIGLAVPPTYLEQWASRHHNTLALASDIDLVASEWPVLRTLGDHVLLVMERTPA